MAEFEKTAEPCVMVIFGATGDLTKRKLFPALYNLAKGEFLPKNFAIVGVGRHEMTSEEFRDQIISDLKEFAGKSPDDDDPEPYLPIADADRDGTARLVRSGCGS